MTGESNEEDDKQFSAIAFFRHVSELIAKINVAPVDRKTLVINKDAYQELGGEFAESDLPFAHIGWEFPTSNTDLVFIVDFYATGVGVCVGSFEYTFCHYEHLGDDEEAVARKIVDMIVTLANGQVSLLCTYTEDEEKLQAIEILYKRPGAQKYNALATYAMFDSRRKLKGRELMTEHFANSGDIADVPLDKEILLCFLPDIEGSRNYSRKQIVGLHQPLTRAAWEKKVDDYYEKKANAIVAKVDKWANKDNEKLTFMEQIVKYGRYRHVEIIWWSLALLLFEYVYAWQLGDIPLYYGGLIFVAVALGVMTRKVEYARYLGVAVPFAYLLAGLAAFMFLGVADKGVWWWVFAICWLFSACEVIGLDIRALWKLRPRSEHSKTRMKLK